MSLDIDDNRTGRRANQCHRDGCDSQAHWQLRLHLECVGIGGERLTLRAPLTIKLCNNKRHHEAAFEYVLSERNKAAIAAGLTSNGFPPPDFESAGFVMVPLDHIALVA